MICNFAAVCDLLFQFCIFSQNVLNLSYHICVVVVVAFS